MGLTPDDSPEDDFFNDLSRQPTRLPNDAEAQLEAQDDGSQAPKPKRIACVLCRKRKLKCDGAKPACGTCNRLQHDCSYDEVRRKSGPKRGYVKALEARLAQVETMLKGQDEEGQDLNKDAAGSGAQQQRRAMGAGAGGDATVASNSIDVVAQMERMLQAQNGTAQAQTSKATLNTTSNGPSNLPREEEFPWEMIGLGLDEPLPPQEAIDELTQTFFEKIHPSNPMMHRPRYYAAMHLAPHARPPLCLRYAMWANAAAVTDKYEGLQEIFYHRARKYIQQDEMRGHGESMITVAHAQTWALLATYEFKLMMFPRAWMSSGRASRMTLMMGLHRLDGTGLEVKQCLPPPKDWTEREERRRTFWMSFCIDRYSSIGTGWPMVIEERDILTNMPVDEMSFEMSRPQKTVSLKDALESSGAQKLSSYGGVVLMASLFGRNLTHLHRPGPDDNDDDMNGEFWKRHRNMDNILSHTALALPDSLRLPQGLNDPNVVFLNMNIHTSTICLHQAAIFKADKNRMPARVSAESKVRCITAAAEIASVMRTISHLDLAIMNPFISFCLYVAARVFVQYLKSRPKDNQIRTSLQFVLSAMQALKRKNPLTESFLVQLDVDLESAGLEDSHALRQNTSNLSNAANKMPPCPSAVIGVPETNGGQRVPTYGDTGLAAYNQPNAQNVPVIPITSRGPEPYDYGNQTTAPADSFSSTFLPTQYQFDVTNREQRTPGSLHTVNDSNMDTSPDGSGSGGGGQHTPSSQQNNSSHASNVAYSPPNMQDSRQANMTQQQQQHQHQQPQQQDWHTNPALFDPNDPTFTTGFDMNSFTATSFDPQQQQQQQSFSQNQNQFWDTTGTGLTPGGPGVQAVDFMNMSDGEFNQMMEGLGDWNGQVLMGNGQEAGS